MYQSVFQPDLFDMRNNSKKQSRRMQRNTLEKSIKFNILFIKSKQKNYTSLKKP